MRRNASSYYRSQMDNMLNQFDVGEIVYSLIADSEIFYGIVKAVNPKENKVYVAWNNGMISQHDPDEIAVVLFSDPMARDTVQRAADDEVEKVVQAGNFRSRSANRRMCYSAVQSTLQPRRIKAQISGVSGVGPISGGFNIMQNLVKELRQESIKDSEVVDGEGPQPLRSRRALYHRERGRVYQRSQEEQTDGIVYCPRCRKQRHRKVSMSLNPYTKSEKIYICSACGWKITTGNLV